jgi:uncharacterized coiled-coil protein SlyX
VIDGHFEYYAAVRAREKDPRKGEMVNAFVISPKLEDIVTKQATAIRVVESPENPVKLISDTTKLEPRLTNLELRIEKQINEFKSELAQERQRVDHKLKEIQSHIPQKIEALNALNTLPEHELAVKLKRSKIPGADKKAKDIVDARKKKPKQEFEDYRDVVTSVKGLGDKTMLTIIDEWLRN